ncbi:hypothetical protein MJH12_09230 [bacterium]|nr:hypothetical protein [bacterium]
MIKNYQNILWLLFYLLCILRNSTLFTQPRFWAEEGSTYFQTAYNEGFWNGLSQVQMGYFSIIPNVATAVSSLIPLNFAPLPCLIISLLIQSINVHLILYNSHHFWGQTSHKISLFFLMLFLPFSEEVFLNTICSQFHLQLSVFLMIYLYAKDPIPKKHLFIYTLAFLSGGVGLITFVIFFLFIKKDHQKHFKIVIYLFLIGLCIQGFFYSISQTPRLYSYNLKYYLQIICAKHIIGPMFGYALEDFYHGIIFVKNYLKESSLDLLVQMIKISYLKNLLFLCSTSLLIYTLKNIQKKTQLLLSALVLSLVFIFLSLKNGSESFLSFHGGGRYFYASNLIFYMACFELLMQTKKIRKGFKVSIALWYLMMGIDSYFRHPEILVPEIPLQKQTHQKIIQLVPKNFVLQIRL